MIALSVYLGTVGALLALVALAYWVLARALDQFDAEVAELADLLDDERRRRRKAEARLAHHVECTRTRLVRPGGQA